MSGGLPGYRDTAIQGTLFDPPLRGMGTTRGLAGSFVEELTQRVTGAKRMATDSRAEICPDLHVAANLYIESKSVGKTGAIILYEHSIQRAREFVAKGNHLYYFVWHHKAAIGDATSIGDLRQRMLEGMKSLIIVDAPSVFALTETMPVRMMNTAYFGKQGAKGTGWGVALTKLQVSYESCVFVNGTVIPVHAGFPAYRNFVVNRAVSVTTVEQEDGDAGDSVDRR